MYLFSPVIVTVTVLDTRLLTDDGTLLNLCNRRKYEKKYISDTKKQHNNIILRTHEKPNSDRIKLLY